MKNSIWILSKYQDVSAAVAPDFHKGQYKIVTFENRAIKHKSNQGPSQYIKLVRQLRKHMYDFARISTSIAKQQVCC